MSDQSENYYNFSRLSYLIILGNRTMQKFKLQTGDHQFKFQQHQEFLRRFMLWIVSNLSLFNTLLKTVNFFHCH